MASWPLALVILPPQHTVTGLTAWQLIDETTFVVGLAAVAGMTGIFAERRWLFAQMAANDRFGVEFGGLATAAVLGAALCLLPALAFAPGAEPRFESVLRHHVAQAAVALHTVALAIVLLRLPGPGQLVSLGLFLVAWGVPALLPAQTLGEDFVRRALDPTLHLGRDWTSAMSWSTTLIDMMPVLALLIWGRWLPPAPPSRS